MKPKFPDISGLTLHLLAMGLMVCDHLWATIIPGNAWLTWVGRLTYPIFAFLLVEGYSHTRNLKTYKQRLLVFALLSEIPFNLMYSASVIYPFQQNVMWTLLLGLVCLESMDKAKKRWKPLWAYPISALEAAGYILLATLTLVDYSGYGVMTILVFYFFRGRKWYHFLGQFMGLYLINWQLIGGLTVPIAFLGLSMEIPQQGMAIFSLLPIWCYRGRQGYHSKAIQYFCYGFYPVHMLILGLLSQ